MIREGQGALVPRGALWKALGHSRKRGAYRRGDCQAARGWRGARFARARRRLTAFGRGLMRGGLNEFPRRACLGEAGNSGNWGELAELGALDRLARTRSAARRRYPRRCPRRRRVPVRPTPEADAAHLVALLAEGATPMLLNGRLFLLGRVTPKAQALLDAHGAAIARLVAAFAAGKVRPPGARREAGRR